MRLAPCARSTSPLLAVTSSGGPRGRRFPLALLAGWSVLATAFAGAPASAQTSVFDARALDLRPLVQVQAVGSTLAGRPFEVDVFLYRGGASVLAASIADDPSGATTSDRIGRGLGTRDEVAAMNGRFIAHRILQTQGNCGHPAPDYVSRYTVTYYGQKNSRQFTVGGDYTGCPADTRAILDAICAFLWQTIDAPIEYCPRPVLP